ncbi:MAG: tRNA (guanosine(37)-N1)-methyltransferase TrmD [Bacilli bacterium]|nr:tRNA (guanosine(37)-N1)-methyltransferase TrmD [Bacilli bacterium]
MKINILTLFPEMFDGFLTNSIIKRAIKKKVVEINIINIRDFTKDKYGRVDTPPVSGGAGLVMKCQPIVDALKKHAKHSHIILTCARGERYSQKKAAQLAKLPSITIICGHYEGVDERVNKYVDELISIGDYILTGGEVASMAISDSVIRLLKGAIADDSLTHESFNDNLLEYPQYTEPYDYQGDKVPLVLYSGNHKVINRYYRKQQLKLTKKYRPDLFKQIKLSKEDQKLLKEKDIDQFELMAIKKGQKYLPKK